MFFFLLLRSFLLILQTKKLIINLDEARTFTFPNQAATVIGSINIY